MYSLKRRNSSEVMLRELYMNYHAKKKMALTELLACTEVHVSRLRFFSVTRIDNISLIYR